MEQLRTGTQVESQLALLHEISSLVNSNASLDAILGQLVALSSRITSADSCQVYLIEPSTDALVLRASQGGPAESQPPVWSGAVQSVVAVSSGACRDEGYEALISLPLVSAGVSVGSFIIRHIAPHAHNPEEIGLLSFIAEQTGSAVARRRLEEANARLTAEVADLKRQLEERKLIERAKGILQQKHNLTEGEAYLRLRNESRRLRRPMRELAEALILAESLGQELPARSPESEIPEDGRSAASAASVK